MNNTHSMKKIFLILTLIASNIGAATYSDFSKGVDLTARTNVSAAILNQLVDNGTVRSGRGLVIVSNVAPSLVVDSRWSNWVWLDISTDPPVLKVYSVSGGSWGTASVGDGTITSNKLAPNSVINSKIADNAVNTRTITNNAVTTDKLASQAVTTDKLAPLNVTRPMIALGAVDSTILTNNAVIETNIANGVVTTVKIADSAVTAVKIAPGVITSGALSNSIINSNNIMYAGVQGTNIAGGTIVSSNLLANTLTTNNFTSTVNAALPKAWVKFAGASPSAIPSGGSFNVSSVTYNATGDYTVNFATPMANTNFCVQVTTQTTGATFKLGMQSSADAGNVNSVRIVTFTSGVGAADAGQVYVVVYANP